MQPPRAIGPVKLCQPAVGLGLCAPAKHDSSADNDQQAAPNQIENMGGFRRVAIHGVGDIGGRGVDMADERVPARDPDAEEVDSSQNDDDSKDAIHSLCNDCTTADPRNPSYDPAESVFVPG